MRSFPRLLSRMAPKPRLVSNLHTTAHSAVKTTSRSNTSDSDELEVLGIKTWKGKAVFIKPEAVTSSVNDLADQLIDLTFSPNPSKRTHEITRPRGIPHFASPSARTAFSPTKKPTRDGTSKPIHPFFKGSVPDKKPDSGRLDYTRGVHTFAKPEQAKHTSTRGNPFLSPPASPTISNASVESSPIRPPPATQRPRLAPPSSPSSCGSPSTFDSTFTASPSPTKTRARPPPPQNPRRTSSPGSPLRIISPSVKKPLSGQKTFKPSFIPVPKPSPVAAKQHAPVKQPSSDSWTWTKWGWTQQRPQTVKQNPTAPPKSGNSSRETIDPLVMSMQNLKIEKRATRSTAPLPAEEPAPPKPELRKFSHKTWHVGNPLFRRPPTLAYTTDPGEANRLLGQIQGEAIAFDMEWPFSFKRGPGGGAGKTALVQVGDEKLVVLIHLSMMKEFPSKLKEILEDPKIYKLGVNVIGDAQKLVRDYGNVYTRGILDLSDIARTVDAENCKPGSSKIALAKLCEQYIGCELDKGAVRTSNWSHRLTGAQMDYAADDVYSTIMIYNSLVYLGKHRGITIDHSALSIDLSPEVYPAPPTVLQDATGAKTNSTKPNGKSGVQMVKGIAPSKMRAFAFFNMGKSTVEIGKAMRTEDNPLMPNTVRGYLLDVVTSDDSLEYDKQRMYDLLSEECHPCNAARNKAFLAKLIKQLGKQIPREAPVAKAANLVSSDVESSQEVQKEVAQA